MNRNELIKDLEKKIMLLTQGSITKKKVKGNIYYYHRYYENGERKEKYVDTREVQKLNEEIELRKKYEMDLKNLKKIKNKPVKQEFYTDIRIKENLQNFVNGVKQYKKRECFKSIQDYLYNDSREKVFILYGLRRTGKTTLIRQTILEMNGEDFDKAVYIKINATNTLSELNKDLQKVESLGYKYIFIDEVTLLEDFIEGASLFSDIYASSGLKIILSGTDSLGFMITKSEQLYDRCILLHTTFIPYFEFEQVLGIKGIDEYIRYGGTMSLSGTLYNQNYVFNNLENTNEYIDTAISKNIQHSLKYYHDGSHFRSLQELYENNELTNVINRVVEDINHRFTKEVLNKEFKSNDLALSSRNLRKDNYLNIDEINKDLFLKRLKEMLEIIDKQEQTISLDNIHAFEIKEYLQLLDLICEIDERSFPNINVVKNNIVITQPGLRYAQANALIDSLLLDEKFSSLSLKDKNYLSERILNEIKGRMMEDIVLLETKMANPYKEVFKLKFAIGEFDMVVFDKEQSSCEIYEIKYSKEIVTNQYRHLIEEEKLKLTTFKFGEIKSKNVIYRGDSKLVNDIRYINVEEYLNNLRKI